MDTSGDRKNTFCRQDNSLALVTVVNLHSCVSLGRRIATTLLIVCIAILVTQNAWAKPESDTLQSKVFVIDISASMFEIMYDIKTALKEYATEAGAGDSIAILHFKRMFRSCSGKPSLAEHRTAFPEIPLGGSGAGYLGRT